MGCCREKGETNISYLVRKARRKTIAHNTLRGCASGNWWGQQKKGLWAIAAFMISTVPQPGGANGGGKEKVTAQWGLLVKAHMDIVRTIQSVE